MLSSLWGSSKGPVAVVYPELATPKTKEEYIQLAKDKLKEVFEVELPRELAPLAFNDAGDRGWNDIKVFDRPATPEQPNLQGVKVVATLPGTPKLVYQFFWDLSVRKATEPDLLEIAVVETITPDIEVLKTRYSAPFPVAPREFAAIRYRVANEKDNEYYIISFSINHDAIKSDSRVLSVNALIMKPVAGEGMNSSSGCATNNISADKTQLIRIIDVEPKGNVPNFIVTMTKNGAGDFVRLVRKFLLDGYAPKN